MRHHRKIRIFFDANPLLGEARTGVGHYTYQVISELSKIGGEEVEIICHYFSLLNRKKHAESRMPQATNIIYKPCWFMPAKFFALLRKMNINIPIEILILGKADVAIFPNYFTYSTLLGAKIIPTIHDLAYIKFPHTLESRNYVNIRIQAPLSIKRASVILTQSESVKRELMAEYSLPENKIVVNYPMSNIPGDNTNTKPTRKVKKPYLFFISSIEPRKNIPTLIKAYVLLPQNIRKKYDLVLAGGPGWKNETILELIATAQEKGYGIKYIGYVSDAERRMLFLNARLFVMPSLYEGFGMTLIEASQCGLPSVASDIPVFRELENVTDLKFYKPTDDPQALANAINHELQRKKKAPRYQPEIFSWDRSATRLLDSIKSLVNHS